MPAKSRSDDGSLECAECDDPYCPGVGQLREFKDWGDLAAHLSEEQIVEAVNSWARVAHCRKRYTKKHRMKQQLLAKLMRQRLDPDELARINQLAEEKVGEL